MQALPCLGITALFPLLTLPAPWRGLQPLDGWLLLLGYLAYVTQALLRGRSDGEEVEWSLKEKRLAAAGVASLAIGAYFTVFSTEKIVSAFGLSKIIDSLFITAPVAALPEIFATWYVARSGQITSGVTSVIGDHAVTMTLAFIPLTIVGMTINDFQLFWVTLSYLALMPPPFTPPSSAGAQGLPALAGPCLASGLRALPCPACSLGAALRVRRVKLASSHRTECGRWSQRWAHYLRRYFTSARIARITKTRITSHQIPIPTIMPPSIMSFSLRLSCADTSKNHWPTNFRDER